MQENIRISFTLNGVAHAVEVDRDQTLLDLLRTEFGLKGPKYGCGMGQCGACTVLIGTAPARACVIRAAKSDGAQIRTLEGLRQGDRLHPVQQGFVEKEGAQCGYCLNGMVMTAVALLEHNPHPSRDEISHALRQNLCRCGTHKEIVSSVLRAVELKAGTRADG